MYAKHIQVYTQREYVLFRVTYEKKTINMNGRKTKKKTFYKPNNIKIHSYRNDTCAMAPGINRRQTDKTRYINITKTNAMSIEHNFYRIFFNLIKFDKTIIVEVIVLV